MKTAPISLLAASRLYCERWAERAALIKKRRGLRCEIEEKPELVGESRKEWELGADACWRGGRGYDANGVERSDEWCEPCIEGRAITNEIYKLTRKIVGIRTRMLAAAKREGAE